MLIFEKPINIALIFDQEVSSGGGYQQGLNAALLAKKLDPKLVNICFFHTKNFIKKDLKNNGIDSQLINLSLIKKIYLYIKTTEKYRLIYKIIRLIIDFNFFESFLIKRNIDLVYFISPSRFALDLNKLNFIFTIWDLCHRDHIEFAEVKLKGEFENRELRINYAVKRAVAIIVDSEYGKKNLSQKYNADKDRIGVIPFEPLLDIKNKENISLSKRNHIKNYKNLSEYIFYPAQIWPHKNHIYIVKALSILKEKHNININAVFSGGDKRHKDKVISFAKKFDLLNNIFFTGFISNKELIALYKFSLALVMPTYFGPTNIPPLEAFNIGVPVIYPDLIGLRDQVGDAALLADLNDPNSLSNCILKLKKDTNLRKDLIKKGFLMAEKNKNEDRLNTLKKLLVPFINKYSNLKIL
tara:strand:+ start:85 stop:1320 length:1236 start_codon:yes stop_codon:yes gene_type:complete